MPCGGFVLDCLGSGFRARAPDVNGDTAQNSAWHPSSANALRIGCSRAGTCQGPPKSFKRRSLARSESVPEDQRMLGWRITGSTIGHLSWREFRRLPTFRRFWLPCACLRLLVTLSWLRWDCHTCRYNVPWGLSLCPEQFRRAHLMRDVMGSTALCLQVQAIALHCVACSMATACFLHPNHLELLLSSVAD